jgi:hypothetical protein
MEQVGAGRGRQREQGNFREFHVECEVGGGKRSALLLKVQFWFRPKREQ